MASLPSDSGVESAASGSSADGLPRQLIWAMVAGICLWTFWDRWRFLSASELPTGIDGHFYAVQLRSILQDGTLYYDSAPLSLWIMAPLAWATDPITGLAMGAALASAALVVTSYLLAHRITGSRPAAVISSAIIATSAGGFYLPTEFVKNAFALPLGMASLLALSHTLQRNSGPRMAATIGLYLATYGTHRAVFVLFVALGVGAVLSHWYGRNRRNFFIAAGALTAAAAAVLYSQYGLLSASLSSRADLSLAALKMGPRTLDFNREPLWALGVAVLMLITIATAWRTSLLRLPGPKHSTAIALGFAALALIIACPWLDIRNPQGIGFRLRIISFVPLAMCTAYIAAAVATRIPSSLLPVTIMLVVGFLMYRPSPYTDPVVRTDPMMAMSLAHSRGIVPEGHIVVCPERQIVFMNMWHTGIETRLHPTGLDPQKTWRLIPMAYMGPGLFMSLQKARKQDQVAKPLSLHPGHPSGLVLMEELTWQWILEDLHPGERSYYQRWPVH